MQAVRSGPWKLYLPLPARRTNLGAGRAASEAELFNLETDLGEETVSLRLPRNAVGQILDGLDVLAEQWEATAAYHRDGTVPEDCLVRECSDEGEAEWVAAFYRQIIGLIEAQFFDVPDDAAVESR